MTLATISDHPSSCSGCPACSRELAAALALATSDKAAYSQLLRTTQGSDLRTAISSVAATPPDPWAGADTREVIAATARSPFGAFGSALLRSDEPDLSALPSWLVSPPDPWAAAAPRQAANADRTQQPPTGGFITEAGDPWAR